MARYSLLACGLEGQYALISDAERGAKPTMIKLDPTITAYP